MFYNAKYKNGFEQIGMAVSRDMINWSRYGTNSVIVNGEAKKNGISGDPQIVKIGDVWVMFYFGAGWNPTHLTRLPAPTIWFIGRNGLART